jgi:hypothetical protein
VGPLEGPIFMKSPRSLRGLDGRRRTIEVWRIPPYWTSNRDSAQPLAPALARRADCSCGFALGSPAPGSRAASFEASSGRNDPALALREAQLVGPRERTRLARQLEPILGRKTLRPSPSKAHA